MTPDVIDLPPAPAARLETLADVLHHLGDIPADRVFSRPYPATEADVLRFRDRHPKRLVELVDGFLVEKAMGHRESLFAVTLIGFLVPFVRTRNLGIVSGPDAIMRLEPGRIRLPDVSFTAWASLPTDVAHLLPCADFPPDLAVEILSHSNTRREAERKRHDYFAAGTKLVWEIDPSERTIAVYTEPEAAAALLTETDILEGGNVLPGFELPLSNLFNEPQLNPRA